MGERTGGRKRGRAGKVAWFALGVVAGMMVFPWAADLPFAESWRATGRHGRRVAARAHETACEWIHRGRERIARILKTGERVLGGSSGSDSDASADEVVVPVRAAETLFVQENEPVVRRKTLFHYHREARITVEPYETCGGADTGWTGTEGERIRHWRRGVFFDREGVR